jgi:4,5-DOPA dioxygenase extradiol
MKQLTKAIFISHGGGPLPLLGDERHLEMVACLREIAASIPRPEAIVVVSAHWEEQVPTITSASRPPLVYDYYGFPPESYEIQYPCAGEPGLAREIHRALENNGTKAALDEVRGLDHGVFVPLKIMYPEADIPCVQLSLVRSLDPARHMDIGAALGHLASEKVLLLGSGFSFHNMRAFFEADNAQSRQLNESFESWLQQTCAAGDLGEQERRDRLNHWSAAPGGRYCHPREEHLLPLHVCYGAAQGACSKVFGLNIMNKKSSMYLW